MGSIKIMFPCGREHDFHGFAHSNSAHDWCFFLFVVSTGLSEAAFCWDEAFLEAAVYLFTFLASPGDSLSHILASVLPQFVAPGFLLSLVVNFGEEIDPNISQNTKRYYSYLHSHDHHSGHQVRFLDRSPSSFGARLFHVQYFRF